MKGIFDAQALWLSLNQMDYPDYKFYALADSEACAAITLKILEIE